MGGARRRVEGALREPLATIDLKTRLGHDQPDHLREPSNQRNGFGGLGRSGMATALPAAA